MTTAHTGRRTGRGQPVRLGRFAFPNKTAAKRAVRGVLNTNPIGEPLTGEALEVVRATLDRHPWADEKIGTGVAAIRVGSFVEYGRETRQFWIERTDGTVVEFSYLRCFDRRDHRADMLAAMRLDVADQIEEFRQAYFARTHTPTCALTGQPLCHGEGHADHVEPFVTLAEEWIASVGGVDVITLADRPSGIGSQLADPLLRAAWRDFHARRAQLRMVHRSANAVRNGHGIPVSEPAP